ncbi:MAG: hypothetical protein L0387_42095 [Acidobacteria bacterium]|nr:hypothetical protein [Acidobacteriota bacterium]
MKPIRLLGFVALLLIVGAADTGIPATSFLTTFDLDSTKSTYPFVMRLQGTIELQADSLVIEVHSGLIRSAIPAHLGEVGIARDVQIAFGLGEKTTKGWTTSRDTPAQIVAPSLSPGETRSLGPLHFVISDIKGIPIRDRWLAATLRVTQRLPGVPAGPLESYACAEDNLLGATAASRERAKLMRTAYSHTC